MKTNEQKQSSCQACEQVLTYFSEDPTYCSPCIEEINAHYDSQPPLTEWELEDWASQYDDDPNPYHGTYSEE